MFVYGDSDKDGRRDCGILCEVPLTEISRTSVSPLATLLLLNVYIIRGVVPFNQSDGSVMDHYTSCCFVADSKVHGHNIPTTYSPRWLRPISVSRYVWSRETYGGESQPWAAESVGRFA